MPTVGWETGEKMNTDSQAKETQTKETQTSPDL